MRLATYNHMFGCDGRSLAEFLMVHAMHGAKQYMALEKRADVLRTVRTVQQADVGILGITEVLGERQRRLLQEALGIIGYQSFHVGHGHGLGGNYGGNVETMVATKQRSEVTFVPSFDVPARLGFGGGVVGVYIRALNLYVIQVHLPLAGNKTGAELSRQMRAIIDEMNRIQKMEANPRIVLMGDFNMPFAALVKDFPELAQCEKLSSDEPTCSVTDVLRIVYRRNIDHILGFGVSSREAGIIEGASDHALVWAEVE